MDICSFLLGVGVAVAGGILLYGVIFMIERPNLEVLPDMWQEKKWVGVFVGNINYYSTDRGGEARVDGYDFMIYGISIRNKPRRLLPRKTSHISNTTATLFNQRGEQVSESRECRWWSHDLSSLDNLFVPAKVDINQRRKMDIPEDVSRNLAVAYCPLGQSACRIFAIDSDRVGRFNSNDDRMKGTSPHFALIKIRGDNISKDIRLEIASGGDTVSISAKDKFPF